MTKAHLLIVEDDETLADLLSAHLRAREYTVTVAPTAEMAPSLLVHQPCTHVTLLGTKH